MAAGLEGDTCRSPQELLCYCQQSRLLVHAKHARQRDVMLCQSVDLNGSLAKLTRSMHGHQVKRGHLHVLGLIISQQG